jgi:hypothetical protein
LTKIDRIQDEDMAQEKKTTSTIELIAVPRAARIMFDSDLSSLPSGIRGMAIPDRHLLFADSDLDIHVKITDAGRQKKEIYGQVIPRTPVEEKAGTVKLQATDEHLETTETDSFGEFSFDNVPTGAVSVEIVMAMHRVVASFEV